MNNSTQEKIVSELLVRFKSLGEADQKVFLTQFEESLKDLEKVIDSSIKEAEGMLS